MRSEAKKKQRIADGLCIVCGENPIMPGNKNYCIECRDRANLAVRRIYKKYKEAGLCVKCGAPISPESTCLCEKHLEYDRKHYINWHGRGGKKRIPVKGTEMLLKRMRERLPEDIYQALIADRAKEQILRFVAEAIKEKLSK